MCILVIYEWQRQKRRQRSSLFAWKTYLKCHTNHLAARMIWTTNFGRTSFLVGWWFGMVRTGWSNILLKHPFRQVAVLLFILFFKSAWSKIAIAAGIESFPSPKQQRRPLPSLLSVSYCSSFLAVSRSGVSIYSRHPF